MADLIPSRTVQRNTISGSTQLLGLIMGLCAIFGVFATAVDWREETAQARWPSVAAVIERGGVTSWRRAQGDGGAIAWKLDYRVRFAVNGAEQIATLTSSSASSNTAAAELHAWAARHRRGGQIDVRYDPSHPSRVVFGSSDVPSTGARTHTDLVLVLLFSMASAGLLALAKHLRQAESRALSEADIDTPPLGGRIALAIVSAAVGFAVIGTTVNAAIHAPDPFASERVIAVPAGLIFVLGGALVALPPGGARWRHLLSALLVTCFASTFDWVAFGPGERTFSAGTVLGFPIGVEFAVGESFGRAVFGIVAIVLDIFAMMMWISYFTALFRTEIKS